MTASRTRVKICGITRVQDALMAERLGVDAVGFVFVSASKRCVTLNAAADIASQLGAFTSVVGLFLDAPVAEVEEVLTVMPQLLPQFHGQESGEYCDRFNRPYIKAIGVGSSMPTKDELSLFRNATGFLFDSNEPGALGGTGHVFDWTRLEEHMAKPLILAGGLQVDNIKSAINRVRPYAVDVSSGVESAKGIKDASAMTQFMSSVIEADSQISNYKSNTDANTA